RALRTRTGTLRRLPARALAPVGGGVDARPCGGPRASAASTQRAGQPPPASTRHASSGSAPGDRDASADRSRLALVGPTLDQRERTTVDRRRLIAYAERGAWLRAPGHPARERPSSLRVWMRTVFGIPSHSRSSIPRHQTASATSSRLLGGSRLFPASRRSSC